MESAASIGFTASHPAPGKPVTLPAPQTRPIAMTEHSDAEQFQRWWTAALPSLSIFVHGMVPDANQAEDVLQDVAVVALRRFDDFDRSRSFRGWVFGIAKLTVLSKRRQYARSKILAHTEVVEALADTAERHADELIDQRAALRQCLQEVDGKARDALELRYADGLAFEDIAERLTTTAVASRKMLSRLRERLRDCITARMRGMQA